MTPLEKLQIMVGSYKDFTSAKKTDIKWKYY